MDTITQLQQLDEFSRKTIILEFPEIFPEYQNQPLEVESVEYFQEKTFSLNEFFGAFLLVIACVTVIGSIFG
jgi:hypothetical protein